MNNPKWEHDIAPAAEIIRNGGLVAFPTETVYGLGANALDANAAARIFEVKKRPTFDPLIVHVADLHGVQAVTDHVPESAESVASHFWPGPLTLVMKRAAHLPGVVTSGLDTVAVRVPSHPAARALLQASKVPIAAPSANTFGHLSPTRAQHVRDDLDGAVDLVIDGGPTQWGIESTIVDVTSKPPKVLRYGAVGIEELRELFDIVDVKMSASSNPSAPGQLDHHYAPRTPLELIDRGTDRQMQSDSAYLAFSTPPTSSHARVEVLTEDGDLVVAAAKLFDVLHDLDTSGVNLIYAERVPDEGLGRAINDRLRRGSSYGSRAFDHR